MKGNMRVAYASSFGLVDYLVWDCPRCGPQSEPMG